MIHLLPTPKIALKKIFFSVAKRLHSYLHSKRGRYALAATIDLVLITTILINGITSASQIITPLVSPLMSLHTLPEGKNSSYEVYGYAPHWNIDKLDGVDFKTLTTLAYFGIELNGDGTFVKDDPGFQTFKSSKATELFKKAHANSTRVVLTLTQMQNDPIRELMDDSEAQKTAIDGAVELVKKRGIDGICIDLEYTGNPGQEYRDKFTKFVADLTARMHQEIPQSQVSVAVYASAVKDPKIYDIQSLAALNIKVFMMAYDFAVAGSDNAIPTSPLNGHEKGKYWYDVATATNDFLKVMPSKKLILGVPYYGYDYLVYEPVVKAETRPWYSWRGKPTSQTFTELNNRLRENVDGIGQIKKGWDEDGKVGYVAYHLTDTDTWRMIFMEDTKSLGIKYDFAKSKNLAGVGIWALGNDEGTNELWALLQEKIGSKSLADSKILEKQVADINE